MFIVIDWIDGSWKGTQVNLVYEKLKNMWYKVKMFDFPRYNETSSYFVQKYLNGDYGKDLSSKAASLLYAVDRFDASAEIKKALEEYDFVVSNRYATSNMIHQSAKLKSNEEVKDLLDWLDEIEYKILWIPRPDKVIFLDVCPEISAELLKMKEDREYIKNGKNLDIHEEDKNHLKNAYDRANFVCNYFDEWVKVECFENGKILSKEVITDKIFKEIL